MDRPVRIETWSLEADDLHRLVRISYSFENKVFIYTYANPVKVGNRWLASDMLVQKKRTGREEISAWNFKFIAERPSALAFEIIPLFNTVVTERKSPLAEPTSYLYGSSPLKLYTANRKLCNQEGPPAGEGQCEQVPYPPCTGIWWLRWHWHSCGYTGVPTDNCDCTMQLFSVQWPCIWTELGGPNYHCGVDSTDAFMIWVCACGS